MTKTSEDSVTEKAATKAREAAKGVADAAAGKSREKAEAVRDSAAGQARKSAAAAEAAADEFDAGSVQARAIEEVARRIDDLAEQIRSTDIDRMARAVAGAARRNPMMFVAGAALTGFAATRFLKARTPRSRGEYAGDPWAGGPEGGTALHIGSARRDVPPRGR